jgi:hypothetical protein
MAAIIQGVESVDMEILPKRETTAMQRPLATREIAQSLLAKKKFGIIRVAKEQAMSAFPRAAPDKRSNNYRQQRRS